MGHNLRDCHIIVASLHDMSLQGDMMLLFGPYIFIGSIFSQIMYLC